MDEDSKAVGSGLKWLTHLLKRDVKHEHLSNGGKKILDRLVKDNYLQDDAKNKSDNYLYKYADDDEDEESSGDENSELGLNHERREKVNDWESRNDESKRPRFFETILGIVYNNAARSSTTGRDSIKTPTTKDIMKECISQLEQSAETNNSDEGEGQQQNKILSPANIPCSLDSNQFIFSALLFLSEDIYQDLASSKSSIINDGSSTNYNTYFPKMPLLLKRKTSSSSSAGSDSVMIPGGFQINHENIVLSSEHEDRSTIFDREFLRKLSMLESCFLSISSKIEHIPRLHVIPRIGMGFIQNREEEKELIKLGDVGKAMSGLNKCDRSIHPTVGKMYGTSKIEYNEGGTSTKSSVQIKQRSKSLKRKISMLSSVANQCDDKE